MSFPREILVKGIQIADRLTKGVQCQVVWEPYMAQSATGALTYGDPRPLSVVLEQSFKTVTSTSGEPVNVFASLTVIGDVKPVVGASGDRKQPIDLRDKITLPDGRFGPLVDTPNSAIDPKTARGFIHVIHMAAR